MARATRPNKNGDFHERKAMGSWAMDSSSIASVEERESGDEAERHSLPESGVSNTDRSNGTHEVARW